MNITAGYNKHINTIIQNEQKAKELDDMKHRFCNTCKYNKVINLESFCSLLNVNGMKYCSKWEKF